MFIRKSPREAWAGSSSPRKASVFIYLEKPIRVASTTRINLEEPVRVASSTRINLEEPVRVASPTRMNSFLRLSVSL